MESVSTNNSKGAFGSRWETGAGAASKSLEDEGQSRKAKSLEDEVQFWLCRTTSRTHLKSWSLY